MQKHIILLLMTFCLAACRPDEGEEKVEVQSQVEETTSDVEESDGSGDDENKPVIDPSINDWGEGSSSSTGLTEK